MRGVWVPFDSTTINRMLGLADGDSSKYRELFLQLDYAKILRKLTVEKSNLNTKGMDNYWIFLGEASLKRLRHGFIS